MRKLRAGLMGLLSTLVLVAGLGLVPGSPAGATSQEGAACYELVDQFQYSKEIPAVEEVSHQEYRYSREVPQSHEEPVYGYQKYVKGKVQRWDWNYASWVHGKRTSGNVGNGSWGEWENTNETFDWTPWLPEYFFGGPTGEHNHSAQLGDAYQSGDHWYRKVTTRAKGVQVQTGTVTVNDPPLTEYFPSIDGWTTEGPTKDGWTKIAEQKVVTTDYEAPYTVYYLSGGEPTLGLTEANWTTDVDPEGWTFVDKRTIDGEQIPCFEIEAGAECGSLTASLIANNTGFPGFLSGVEGDESPLLNDHPWAALNAFEVDTPEGTDLSYTFPEGYNGGSVTVTVFAHGPEQDTYAVDGRSPIFKTLTIDTDCLTDIEVTAPVQTTGACGEPDTVKLTALSGGTWLVDGTPWNPEVPVTMQSGATLTFRFVASEGYEVIGQDTFEITSRVIEDCPTTTTTAPPTATSGNLPKTGTSTSTQVAVALTLAALGGLLLMARRRFA